MHNILKYKCFIDNNKDWSKGMQNGCYTVQIITLLGSLWNLIIKFSKTVKWSSCFIDNNKDWSKGMQNGCYTVQIVKLLGSLWNLIIKFSKTVKWSSCFIDNNKDWSKRNAKWMLYCTNH